MHLRPPANPLSKPPMAYEQPQQNYKAAVQAVGCRYSFVLAYGISNIFAIFSLISFAFFHLLYTHYFQAISSSVCFFPFFPPFFFGFAFLVTPFYSCSQICMLLSSADRSSGRQVLYASKKQLKANYYVSRD